MIEFEFADLHCHPTLKTYGRTFDKGSSSKGKSDIWHQKKPTFHALFLQRLTGITRFSQADFSSMLSSRVRFAFVSLYPFEKGFFFTPWLPDHISARLAAWVTSIGFHRVTYLQRHKNYFEDLMGELRFLEESPRNCYLNGTKYSWSFLKPGQKTSCIEKRPNHLYVIPTIEGAHILNTGLREYGRKASQGEVLDNIRQLKKLENAPFFITLAHNFNNDLCGHAPSLNGLGGILDQSENMGTGFTKLGWEVIRHLLDPEWGRPIYIDLKHMSLKARKEFYTWHRNTQCAAPFLVSHGAFTGLTFDESRGRIPLFADDEINFYDEELVLLARSGGVFGLQLDAKRLAPKADIRKSVFSGTAKDQVYKSAGIFWNQIRHAAEVLDAHNLPAWDTLCIGSDFDGTIDPLERIWSVREFNILANELMKYAKAYLKAGTLKQERNRTLSAEEVVRKLTLENAERFVIQFWQGVP